MIKKSDKYFLAAFAVLLGAGIMVNRIEAAAPHHLARPLGELPLEVGKYFGREALAVERTYQAESADSSVYRSYTQDVESQSVQVYVGYWAVQSEKKRIKLPRYVSEGWSYYLWRQRELNSPKLGIMKFNEFLNEGAKRKELVYYCYVVNGKIMNNEYWLRAMNMWNVILHRRSNAAVVRVSSFLDHGEAVKLVETRIDDFLQIFMPVLMAQLPG